MKFAASIRYGGELVEPQECDYNDYKYLGLLCPECKSPVFLVKSQVRSRLEKTYAVSAHFSHFKEVDPTYAQKCELRVSNYDDREMEKRKAIASVSAIETVSKMVLVVTGTPANSAGACGDPNSTG
jgi:hypothetical protein